MAVAVSPCTMTRAGCTGIHHRAQFHDQRGGQPVQRLVRAHQVEVVIGRDPRNVQHLIQHPRCCAETQTFTSKRGSVSARRPREQLDRFGAGAENDRILAGLAALSVLG
jgi:hypothetical protein